MAVEKTMTPFKIEGMEDDAEELQIEIVNPDAVAMETEDGGVIIDFEGDIADELLGNQHDDNLAEVLDDDDLASMASDLLADFQADRRISF